MLTEELTQVSGFEVFKRVLDDQRSLPAGQATKDLLACINFILRKFFKNLQQNPLLALEAFWPKPRGHLRKLGGANSDDDSDNGDPSIIKVRICTREGSRHKTMLMPEVGQAPKIPADLEFKPDKEFTWSQKLGIAIRCLMDDRKVHWVMWLVEVRHRLHSHSHAGTKVLSACGAQLLRLVCVERQEVTLSTDGEPRAYDPDLDDTRPPSGPSDQAKERMSDHRGSCGLHCHSSKDASDADSCIFRSVVRPDTEEQASALVYNPHLKLLCTLLRFEQMVAEAPEEAAS